jgi:hypothetical protein
MTKPKFRKSIYFTDHSGNIRFLVQVLNIGKGITDELKFVFTHSASGVGGVYTESEGEWSHGDIIRLQPEISYHSDGSMHIKMPSYSERTETIYKNPMGAGSRRKHLADIFFWEPIIKYTILDYSLCKKPIHSTAIVIPNHSSIMDGTPFNCVLFLGNSSIPSPKERVDLGVFRLSGLTTNLDLLCCFYESDYKGEYRRIPNTTERVLFKGNIIQTVIHREDLNAHKIP